MTSTLLTATALLAGLQDDRAERIRIQLGDVPLKGDWFYDDVPAAFEEARRRGRPLLVVFR